MSVSCSCLLVHEIVGITVKDTGSWSLYVSAFKFVKCVGKEANVEREHTVGMETPRWKLLSVWEHGVQQEWLSSAHL